MSNPYQRYSMAPLPRHGPCDEASDHPALYCDQCGGGIWTDDDYLRILGLVICEHCADQAWNKG